MYLKKLSFVIFFIIVLFFTNAKAGDPNPESNNNNKSDSQKQSKEQNEQIKRIKDQQDIEKVLNILNQNMQQEQNIRKREKAPQTQEIQDQRLKDQYELDNLVKKIREQIQQFLDRYARQQPLNDEYTKQLIVFNINLQEYYDLIERIGKRRVYELRVQELHSINVLRKKIHDRREFEKKQIALEEPPNDQNARDQRVAEQETLKILERKVFISIQRIQDWHIKDQPIKDDHEKLLNELNINLQNFTQHNNRMDERRRQERRAHIQEIIKMQQELNTFREYELEQRKIEQLPKTELSLVQRKKDEFVGDKLDGAIRSRLNNLLQKLSQNYPLDSEYTHQRDLLNQDWQKFIALTVNIKQRRIQEQNPQKYQDNITRKKN